MHRSHSLALIAVLLAGCRAPAPVAARAGTIEVVHPYAFAPLIGDESSAYFSLHNTGHIPDTLTAVTAGHATAMLHASRDSGGVVRMVMLETLPIPGGATVTLAVGQIHLMLTGLNPAPHPGDTLELALTFAHGGVTTVAVPVYKYGEAPAE